MVLSLLPGAASAVEAGAPAQLARGGHLDLSTWDFDRDGIALLDGDWDFFWQRWVPPADPARATERLAVPGEWKAPGGRGYGTYRLTVDCRHNSPLALSLPMQHSAVELYVNGTLVARQGNPGDRPDSYSPGVGHQTVALGSRACPLEIVAQVANYDLFRGGMVRSMQIGTERQLAQRREQAIGRSLIALGGVLVLGFVALTFWLRRRRDRTPLYFGLFSLSFGVSLALSGERALEGLVIALGFEGHLRVLFTTWFGSLAAFALFLRSLYPKDTPAWAVRAAVVFSSTGMVLAALTPMRVFGYTGPVLQAGAALVAIGMAVVLVRAWRRGSRPAALLLAGLGLMAATVAHDVIFFRHLLTTSWVPYGMFGFVLAPAVLLAQRFARALGSEELRSIEQRERVDLLVRSTQAGVLDWNAVTGEIRYSDRYREMLGYNSDAEPPPFRQLVHPEDRDRVHASFMTQLRDTRVKSDVRVNEPMDYRMIRCDGLAIWIHAEAISVCGDDGRTLRFICSFIDISDRKSMEDELRRSAHELEDRMKFINDLVDALPLALSMRDLDGRYVFANRTWERYYGISRKAAIGTTLHEQLAPQERASVTALDAEVLARGPDNPLYTEDAPFRGREYTQMRTVMTNARNEALGVVIATEDVTARRATERDLATGQKRLELVVRGARVGIVDWDGRTHETWYSPRFREIRGYAPDADTAGWPDYFKVMIHPDDRERVIRRWVPFIKGRGPEGPRGDFYSAEEYRLLRADGSYGWVQVSGMAVRDERDFVVRWIAAVIDISERHRQEEALRASHDQIAAQATELEARNEALKENVRLREEVERIGRHDIKTPLNSIVAVPRLLREERRLGPEADELLGIVERAGYRILSMVNLSLDLYKMEQGSYVFRPDAVDLRDLFQKVVDDVKMHAASKQVRIRVEIGDVGYAWAEELLCYSLLANLLKNGVEASPEQEVVTLAAEAGADGTVVLRIHNRGTVPAEVRGSFFQKYATQGKASGTGLGTYSARLMARVQDGDIAMSTSEQEGTTLTVTLRAAPAGSLPATMRHAEERQRIEPLQVASLPPTRVLLVDDDEYNLLIVRRFLPTPPFTVETAINGKVALSAAELQWPDVIFMDLDMPVMGGLQAVRELRAMEQARQAKRCTIIALSSHDDDETRDRSLAAGFDRYLTKPVRRDVIHAVLMDQGARAAGTETPVPPTARPAVNRQDPVIADPDVAPLLDEFMHSRRRLIDDLGAAAHDRGEVRRIAHQLAGSFGLYGFHWASEQSRWIEGNSSEVGVERLRELAAELRGHLDSVEIRFVPAAAEAAAVPLDS